MVRNLRITHATRILGEFSKHPLSEMPRLRDRYMRGEVFGTIYDIRWLDGVKMSFLVFDFENNGRMTENEYMDHSEKLFSTMVSYGEITRRKGLFYV